MKSHRRFRGPAVLVVIGAALGLLGCRSREPESPSVGLTGAVDPPRPADLGRGAPRFEEQAAYNMYVAPPIRDVCKGPPPFFEFDASETRTTDQPTMQTLADCMLTGPLREKSIRLIGHTDPRGNETYNRQLGFKRADRVKAYLVSRGVDPSRVIVQSAGEERAHAEPAEWATDRRVEIQLAR